MPYFKEEDQKRKRTSEGKERTWSEEAHSVLVLAIQTLDEECFKQIQNDETPLGNLRHRVDLILNSNHWEEKWTDEREARDKPAWRALLARVKKYNKEIK